MHPIILLHGGAGTISRQKLTPDLERQYHDALRNALMAGYKLLQQKKSAVDAVEAAVIELENFPLFNAGQGSVFTNKGTHEMDAAIMDGKTLNAGAVAGIKNIKNPIILAKTVMQKSDHIFLVGNGAEEFARMHNIEAADEKYFFTDFRHQQLIKAKQNDKIQLDHADDKKFGTVGAVALDSFGNIAAATSTGGMTNKSFGRVGDSPIIGAGTYANNKTCAISCTGHGEYFMQYIAAYDVSCLMEYKNYSLMQAAEIVVNDKLKKAGGEGGLIAVDLLGNYALPFNTEGMYRGWMKNETDIFTAIFKDQ